MKLAGFKQFLRITKSINDLKVIRSVFTRRGPVDTGLPTYRGDKKVGGYGKFLIAIPLATFGLGTWQVQRKMWKENLVAEMEQKLSMEPVALPDNLEDLNSMEYQNVLLRGQFIHYREMLMGPRGFFSPENPKDQGGGIFSTQNKGVGYQVITPFKLEGREEVVLVNRGWVPKQKTEAKTRMEGQIEGVVEIQGIVRLSETRPRFTPDHKGTVFFYRDIPKMCDMTYADPYFVDIKYDKSLPAAAPIGGQTRIKLRNEHLNYIITWYSLSLLTGWLWWQKFLAKVPL